MAAFGVFTEVLNNQAVTNIPMDLSSYNPLEVRGSTFDSASGDFFYTDDNGNLGSVTSSGVHALIGWLPASIRGLTFNAGTLYGGVRANDNRIYRLDAGTGGVPFLCDPDELCLGIPDTACPADVFDPGTTICNAGSGDVCDPDEQCPGAADFACPAGNTQLLSAGEVCNPGSGDICDPDEVCSGVEGNACPVDTFDPGTLVCNAGSGDLCDPDELCPGVADAACPAGNTQLLGAGTVCNAGSGDACDPDEVCSGVEGEACPADVFDPGTTVCNPGSGDLCDPDELCTGIADDPCPADFVEMDGTLCVDGDLCNGDETCVGGTCTAGMSLSCGDSDVCTTDTCDSMLGCENEPIPLCEPPLVPTMSTGGLAALLVSILLAGGALLMPRRQRGV